MRRATKEQLQKNEQTFLFFFVWHYQCRADDHVARRPVSGHPTEDDRNMHHLNHIYDNFIHPSSVGRPAVSG
jgi:hypothetical protein